jgi:GNAT superfamily N-acetyltransferase
MYWRQSRKEFSAQHGEPNRQAMKTLVDSGAITGILAYDGTTPVGWCSIAPRLEFPTLAHSRILQPVDDLPVWSVVCFFVKRGYRRKGWSVELLKAAVEFASASGAEIIEGYPVEPKDGKAPDVFMYTGLSKAFMQAGFIEVIRRSATRPIMRYVLEKEEKP